VCFQALVQNEPGIKAETDLTATKVLPVWYGFAPYASRVVGLSEQALASALNSLDKSKVSWSLFPKKNYEIAVDFLKSLLQAIMDGTKAGNLAGAVDKDTLHNVIYEFVRAWWASESNFNLNPFKGEITTPVLLAKNKMKNLLEEIRTLLEEGNRGIYSDVGGFGARYLEFRAGRTAEQLQSAKVIVDYAAKEKVHVEKVKEVYEQATKVLINDDAKLFAYRPIGFGKEAMVAAFAMFEDARNEKDITKKNRIIRTANILMAYREQNDAVAPAFTSPDPVRAKLRSLAMHALTPTVSLPVGDRVWTYADWAKQNKQQPMSRNWVVFEDRFPPIAASFEFHYENPANMWCLPPTNAIETDRTCRDLFV